MNRSEVLNGLLATRARRRYLEIGVQHGLTFDLIEAERRVGVDPAFLFDTAAMIAASPPGSINLHEMTSDVFFCQIASPDDSFDVIFIDGLHTFDQTLRDLLNAMLHLAPDGLLVIDDVLPNSYAASLPVHEQSGALNKAVGDPNPAWMGNVFRLVFFIRYYMPGFSYATVLENHGQTILWRGSRTLPQDELSVEQVSRIEYVDTVLRRDAFNMMPFADIVRLIGNA